MMIKKLKIKGFGNVAVETDKETANILAEKINMEITKMQNDIIRHKIKKITAEYLQGEISYRELEQKINEQTDLEFSAKLPIPKLGYEENKETDEIFFTIELNTDDCIVELKN